MKIIIELKDDITITLDFEKHTAKTLTLGELIQRVNALNPAEKPNIYICNGRLLFNNSMHSRLTLSLNELGVDDNDVIQVTQTVVKEDVKWMPIPIPTAGPATKMEVKKQLPFAAVKRIEPLNKELLVDPLVKNHYVSSKVFLRWDDEYIYCFNFETDEFRTVNKPAHFYTMTQLKDGNYVAGIIDGGILILNQDFEIIDKDQRIFLLNRDYVWQIKENIIAIKEFSDVNTPRLFKYNGKTLTEMNNQLEEDFKGSKIRIMTHSSDDLQIVIKNSAKAYENQSRECFVYQWHHDRFQVVGRFNVTSLMPNQVSIFEDDSIYYESDVSINSKEKLIKIFRKNDEGHYSEAFSQSIYTQDGYINLAPQINAIIYKCSFSQKIKMLVLGEKNFEEMLLPTLNEEGCCSYVLSEDGINVKTKNNNEFILDRSAQYPMYQKLEAVAETLKPHLPKQISDIVKSYVFNPSLSFWSEPQPTATQVEEVQHDITPSLPCPTD